MVLFNGNITHTAGFMNYGMFYDINSQNYDCTTDMI